MKRMLLTLCAVCLIFVLAACSNNEGNAVGTEKPQPVPKNEDAEVNQDPVTITMAAKDFPAEDANSQKLIKAIEDGLREAGKPIKLELVAVQSGTYSEKLGLLLQSGNIPDLMYFQGGDHQFAITQGILEDLTPYINDSTHLKASMSEFNKERMSNYPYLVWPHPASNKVPVVRQDWFDKTTSGKALLENPTIDNYYTFLKEVKEKNGAQYAYTTAGTLSELDPMFAQAFGLTSTWIKGNDGKYSFGQITQFEKEKLEFYAKLYSEGLLDPEYLTKKWDTKEKAFYDGQSAIIAGTQGAVVNIYHNKSVGQNGEAATLIALPPAKGIAQGYTPVDVSKEGRGFAISKTSKNKDLAFAILEFMASPKGLMVDQIGIEGEEYEIVDNKIKLTEKYASWCPHFVGNTINFKPDHEFDPSTPFLSEPAKKSLEMVASMTNNDNIFVMPDDLIAKWDASSAVYNEFSADMVTGKKTGADFDQFVQDWLAAGGQEITDYANQMIK